LFGEKWEANRPDAGCGRDRRYAPGYAGLAGLVRVRVLTDARRGNFFEKNHFVVGMFVLVRSCMKANGKRQADDRGSMRFERLRGAREKS
jgi:energy-converting hydrogenase Eha subunit B